MAQVTELNNSTETPSTGINWTYTALISLVLLFWASSYVGIRHSLEVFSIGNLAFLRYFFTSVGFILLAFFNKIRRPVLKDFPLILLLGLTGFTLYSLLLNYGEQTVSAGIASFIINTVPFFTMLLVIITKQETVNGVDWIGLLIGFSGVAVIIFTKDNVTGFNFNVLYIVGAAFCLALFYVVQKNLLKKYSPMEITSYSVWCGTFLLFFSSKNPFESLVAADLPHIGSVLYLGVFPGMIANLIMAYALKKYKTTNVSTYLFLIPFITLLLGWLLLNEIPTFWTLLGGLLTIIGILIKNNVFSFKR